MSDNLMVHAEIELKRVGYSDLSEDDMSRNIYKQTMGIVQHFGACGHSGGSAAVHIWMINELLQYKTLGPLTDDPEEWVDQGSLNFGGVNTWQNKRNSACFTTDPKFKTYFSVDEFRYGWRARLFGREVMHPTTPA